MDSRLPRVSLILNYEEQDINLCLVCQSNEKNLYLPVGRGFTPADVATVTKCTSVCDKTKNLYLVRRGELNVFEENLSACHAVARLFRVRAKAP